MRGNWNYLKLQKRMVLFLVLVICICCNIWYFHFYYQAERNAAVCVNWRRHSRYWVLVAGKSINSHSEYLNWIWEFYKTHPGMSFSSLMLNGMLRSSWWTKHRQLTHTKQHISFGRISVHFEPNTCMNHSQTRPSFRRRSQLLKTRW